MGKPLMDFQYDGAAGTRWKTGGRDLVEEVGSKGGCLWKTISCPALSCISSLCFPPVTRWAASATCSLCHDHEIFPISSEWREPRTVDWNDSETFDSNKSCFPQVAHVGSIWHSAESNWHRVCWAVESHVWITSTACGMGHTNAACPKVFFSFKTLPGTEDLVFLHFKKRILGSPLALIQSPWSSYFSSVMGNFRCQFGLATVPSFGPAMILGVFLFVWLFLWASLYRTNIYFGGLWIKKSVFLRWVNFIQLAEGWKTRPFLPRKKDFGQQAGSL